MKKAKFLNFTLILQLSTLFQKVSINPGLSVDKNLPDIVQIGRMIDTKYLII